MPVELEFCKPVKSTRGFVGNASGDAELGRIGIEKFFLSELSDIVGFVFDGLRIGVCCCCCCCCNLLSDEVKDCSESRRLGELLTESETSTLLGRR